MVRVSKDWSYRGKEVVVLENARLRVTLLPSSGARVFELVDKATDTDLLWHHPRRGPEPAVLGSPAADLWWAGGIDDIFPTDFPCLYRNEQLPYLGELWTNAWEAAIERDDGNVAEAVFRTRTVISPFEVEKRVRLAEGQSHVAVRYTIRNIGFSPYDWFFGIHPGIRIEKGFRLILPIEEGVIEDGWPEGILAAKGTRYRWPLCPTTNGSVDLRAVPGPEAGWWSFQYGPSLTRPWIGVLDPNRKSAFFMSFDLSFFPSLLLYLGYGGWRNTYSVIPQIGTGWPGDLAGAIEAGRQRTLGVDQSMSTEIHLGCLSDVASDAEFGEKLVEFDHF